MPHIKEGSLFRRKDGRWEARISINNKQITVACCKKQSKALEKLNEAIKIKKAGNQIITKAPSNTKMLYEWLDEWLIAFKKPKLKLNSLSNIESVIRNHIKPKIENCPLNKLTTLIVQAALISIDKPRTREYAHQALNEALNKAKKLKFVKENVCDDVEIPRHQRADGHALTLTEEIELFNKIKGSRQELLILFYYWTGCRQSEALSVTWQDIDFVDKTVHIKGTKTVGSDRIIPLFEPLEKLLLPIREETGYLFGESLNSYICNFKRWRKNLSFNFKIKDLRTTFDTRCFEKGVPDQVRAKWLGHTNIRTTNKYYTKVLSDFEKQQAEKVK